MRRRFRRGVRGGLGAVRVISGVPCVVVRRLAHGTTVGNLGWDDVRFPAPVFAGDTLRVESEVLELRESRSRPENGIVVFAPYTELELA